MDKKMKKGVKNVYKLERKIYWNNFFSFKKNKEIGRLVIIYSILLVIFGIKTYVNNINQKNNLLGGLEVQDETDFSKSLKGKKSDIKGMSQYDKYKMGLDYHDGSDSDHDGLTDKEEIEVYNTDPLKIEQDLLKIIPYEYLKDVNHLFMWLGRDCCRAPNPNCKNCAIKKYCTFNKK